MTHALELPQNNTLAITYKSISDLSRRGRISKQSVMKITLLLFILVRQVVAETKAIRYFAMVQIFTLLVSAQL